MPNAQSAPVADRSRPETIRRVFAGIAARYDLANHLLSAGLDFRWRAIAARTVASWNPAAVLDLATGSGDLALAIGRACPRAEVTGADFCEPMLARARAKGLARTQVADATALPFPPGSFDAVTVAFGLRNMEDYPRALAEIRRVLRPDGWILILDFSLPTAPWLRALYRFYLHRVLPTLARWITGDRRAYEYLGGSIEQFPSGTAMQDLLRTAGFADPTVRSLTGGIVSLYTGRASASSSGHPE